MIRFFTLLFFFAGIVLSAQTSKLKKGYRTNFYADKKIESEGPEAKGLREGYWKFYDTLGRLARTEMYSGGKLNGTVREFDPGSGRTIAKRRYKNGCLHGLSRVYLQAQLYEKKMYSNDTLLWRIGYLWNVVMERESFRNGKRHGVCRYYSNSRNYRDTAASLVVAFKDGLKHGLQYEYVAGKLVVEQEFADGKQDGVRREYYYNGLLFSEQFFKNDQPDGKCDVYLKDVMDRYFLSRRLNYKEGVYDGVQLYLNYDGDTSTIKWYSSGRLDSMLVYWPPENGKTATISIRQFLLPGESDLYANFHYNREGKPESYHTRKTDRTEGFSNEGTGMTFYPNGKLKTKGHWTENMLDSVYTIWYPDGKRMFEAVCEGSTLQRAPGIWNERGVLMKTGSPVYNRIFYTEINRLVYIDPDTYDPADDGISRPPGMPEIHRTEDYKIKPVYEDVQSPPEVISPDTNLVANPRLKPFFPGGEEGWREYLYGQLVYPHTGAKKQPSGKVALSCRVNHKGELLDIIVAGETPGHPEFTAEALRVVKASPRWAPAVEVGAVWTTMILEIEFSPSMGN